MYVDFYAHQEDNYRYDYIPANHPGFWLPRPASREFYDGPRLSANDRVASLQGSSSLHMVRACANICWELKNMHLLSYTCARGRIKPYQVRTQEGANEMGGDRTLNCDQGILHKIKRKCNTNQGFIVTQVGRYAIIRCFTDSH